VSTRGRVGESAGRRAIRAARNHLGKAIRLLGDESADGRDAVVHEVRKRIKKARALAKLARGAVGRKAIRKTNGQLRDAGRPLSEARDASALISTLDSLAERSVGLHPTAAFAEARAALVARRDELARAVFEEGDSLKVVVKALRSARRRLAGWESSDVHLDPVRALKGAYRAARDQFEAAATDPSPDSLHELRKRVKALGYQLKALGLDPSSPATRLQRLAGLLADELGQIHDLDVLRNFLEGREGSGPILITLERRRLDLRRGALLRAGVLFRAKPRAFARSLGRSSRPVDAASSDP
jgi:CHAD domain-containing protein